MSKTAVITGANKGIGLALTLKLIEKGYVVHALCRRSSDELKNGSAHIHEGVDVTDENSYNAILDKLPESIDTLIHVAGFLVDEDLKSATAEAMMKQYHINAIAPLLMTRAFLPKLKQGSKVFIISSRAGSVSNNESGGLYGYRASKAAVNILGKSLSVDLYPKKIGVFLLHPGFVATDMTSIWDKQGKISAQESAEGLTTQIENLTLEQTGSFVSYKGEMLSW